jgi:hypothetical protein
MPHIQIRSALGTASGTSHGTGAMQQVPHEIDPLILNRGALADLLKLLSDNDYDLAMASGDSIEGGGEFVFALKDDERSDECATLLRDNGYRNVRVIEPQFYELTNEKGALEAVIRQLSNQGRQIDEIFTGASLPNGKVPVQITTIATE